MHGRKRVKLSSQQIAKRKKKGALYRKLLHSVLSLRATTQTETETQTLAQTTNETTEEALKKKNSVKLLTAKLLTVNPDVYTVWNIRRECLLECIAESIADQDSVSSNELELTANGCVVSGLLRTGDWLRPLAL